MILADKILQLRKKHNFSQEELAERLQVSRQSVSKWESAASIPDINKIMALAALFSVPTDYLLKEEIELPAYLGQVEQTGERQLSLEEANHFVSLSKTYAKRLALGVFLCILAPMLLIFLTMTAEEGFGSLAGRPEVGIALGFVVLLALVSVAVAIFIISEQSLRPFDFLRRDAFALSFGVEAVLREQLEAFLPGRTRRLALSVVAMILSALPLIVVSILGASDMMVTAMLLLLMAVVACAVFMIVRGEMQKEAFETLLCEGEFDRSRREQVQKEERISAIYWPMVTAIYLGWSFLSGNWGLTWVVWPVAGLLFAAIEAFFIRD